MTVFPKLFSPMQVGTLTLKNRLVLTAHEPRVPLKRFYRYLEERAKGGVALIICSNPSVYGILPYTVGPPTRLPPGYLGGSDVLLPNPAKPDGVTFYDGWLTPLLREETELIHRHGAACFGQLVHTGNYDIFDNWQAGIGPSTVADEMLGNIPHQLDEEEIQEVIFVHAQQARRVKEAGMDGVEVHACHGLLLNSFLSPITNKRTDKYGGSLENRMRFVVEVIEAVRKAVGPDFPVGLRMPGNELVEGGLSLQDMVDIARRIAPKADIAAVQQLMAQGIESEEEIARRLKPQVDYFNISGASESGRKAGVTVPTVSPMDTPHGVFTPFTAAIRKAVGVPVLVSARIVDPAQAERILASGQADLIGVVRAFIADPEFGTKAQEGRADEIRKCTGAGEGCRKRTIQRVGGAAPISCTVNAAVAR
ncbi:MAG: hypothetical protein HYX97_04570, partial [Chloroflexi bacterium]|nr:hypothetical protein [Chloroflexota bacterium]